MNAIQEIYKTDTYKNAQADAMELANLILAAYASNVKSPIDLAIDYIKNEMKQY